MEWENLVNLTPHAINVELKDKTVISIPPSGEVLRLDEEDVKVAEYVIRKKFSLDDSVYDTMSEDKTYIVSIILLPYLKKDVLGSDWVFRHYDFLAPDTGIKSAVRDSEGRIIAVKRFIAP